MSYTEKFNLGKYEWKTMELTEEEVEQVTKEHRELSKKVMDECLEDSKHFAEHTSHSFIVQMATAMFEARCPKLYTMMQCKLQDKIKQVIPTQYTDGSEDKDLRQEKIKFDGESV